MEISPRHTDILAHHPNLTDQDLADYASFVTDDEAEQAQIVQHIRAARRRIWIVRAGTTGAGPTLFCVYTPTMDAARASALESLGDSARIGCTVHALRAGEPLPPAMTLVSNPIAHRTPAPDAATL